MIDGCTKFNNLYYLKLENTGYYAGKLFIQNEEITEIKLHIPTVEEHKNTFLYDNASGNVHFFLMMPYN